MPSSQIQPPPSFLQSFFWIAGALLLITSLYYPSLKGEFFFDDISNIVNNPNIHMEDLSSSSILQTFRGRTLKQWDRPLGFLSFGLNYYWGGLNPLGYHIVNLIIHLLSFLALRKVLLLLFQFHGKLGSPRVFWVSLLASCLWACHPIHITAVTLTVQRFVILSGFFYLLSLYFYLKLRMSSGKLSQGLFFFGLLLSFLLALFSKENILTLFPSLILLELTMLNGGNKDHLKKIIKGTLGVSLALALPLYFFLKNHQYGILDGYNLRPFTLYERLISQGRVLLYYLKLLVFPHPSQYMVIHNFFHSTGWFQPISTFFSLVALFFMVLFAFLKRKVFPIFLFSLLFFLINHGITSSFISLELIYEYRNYIPSFFIFLPISLFFIQKKEKSLNSSLLYFLVLGFLILECWTTFQRNGLYQTPLGVWADNASKAPNVFMPHQNLAIHYFKSGHINKAFEESRAALSSIHTAGVGNKTHTYYHIGKYYFDSGDFLSAYKAIHESLKITPEFDEANHLMGSILLEQGKLSEAKTYLLKAFQRNPQRSDFLFSLCNIELLLENFDSLSSLIQNKLKTPPSQDFLYFFEGEIYRRKEKWEKAALSFEKSLQSSSPTTLSRIPLLQVYSQLKETGKLKELIQKLNMTPLQSKTLVTQFKHQLSKSEWNKFQSFTHVLKLDKSK